MDRVLAFEAKSVSSTLTWGTYDRRTNTCPEWMYYLQQMVLEENKLKYLEKFL